MKTVVFKCGGSTLDQLPNTFYETVANLHKNEGYQPVIVHGGGPLITSALSQFNVSTTFVDGLRVTTNEVLDIVEMVLSGTVNKQIVRKFHQNGGVAHGMSGVDSALLQARPAKNAEKLGFVGEVEHVNSGVLQTMIESGAIPVISPIGIDDNGQRYNLNGDTAASAVAQALQAPLCFLSDVPGVMYDQKEGHGVYEQLTIQQAESLIDKQQVTGGMIPKLRAAMKAVKHGVTNVSMIDGTNVNDLEDYFNGKSIGTTVERGEEMHHV
ncbi:acetylglutamate kinase [Texcoconibacillus texcoconensis]|uniref:Acetylglutamate kinase n=1 Tax=Texcoconibacillus texcoconensis TaxID=1095777 RepID=A0A840QS34_9BACI|nr:acetylglutamate kinase [Texcoconibacillus texcoconensis]